MRKDRMRHDLQDAQNYLAYLAVQTIMHILFPRRNHNLQDQTRANDLTYIVIKKVIGCAKIACGMICRMLKIILLILPCKRSCVSCSQEEITICRIKLEQMILHILLSRK